MGSQERELVHFQKKISKETMNGWKQKWVNQRNKKEILDKNQVRAG